MNNLKVMVHKHANQFGFAVSIVKYSDENDDTSIVSGFTLISLPTKEEQLTYATDFLKITGLSLDKGDQ